MAEESPNPFDVVREKTHARKSGQSARFINLDFIRMDIKIRIYKDRLVIDRLKFE